MRHDTKDWWAPRSRSYCTLTIKQQKKKDPAPPEIHCIHIHWNTHPQRREAAAAAVNCIKLFIILNAKINFWSQMLVESACVPRRRWSLFPPSKKKEKEKEVGAENYFNLRAHKILKLLKYQSTAWQSGSPTNRSVRFDVNLHNIIHKHITHLAFPQFTGSQFKSVAETMRRFILVRDACWGWRGWGHNCAPKKNS